MPDEKKLPWLAERHLGRFDFIDWRGAVAFVALIAVYIIGTGLDSELRASHPIIRWVVMAPLAALALAIGATLDGRTKRRD